MASDESDTKGFYFLGTDVSKIPCFRQSMLTGVSGGVISGLVYFLATRNSRKVLEFATASYAAITLGTWAVCRYRYQKQLKDLEVVRMGMEAKILGEGTDLEKQVLAAENKIEDV